MTGTSRLEEADYERIGSTNLEGAVTDEQVSVTGPCGAIHHMSHREARALAAWIRRMVPDEMPPQPGGPPASAE